MESVFHRNFQISRGKKCLATSALPYINSFKNWRVSVVRNTVQKNHGKNAKWLSCWFVFILGGQDEKEEQRMSDGSLCSTDRAGKGNHRGEMARTKPLFKKACLFSPPPLILMLHSTKSSIRIIINIYQRSLSATLRESQIIQRPVEVQLHFSAVSQKKVKSKSPSRTLPEVLLYWSARKTWLQHFHMSIT